MYVIADSTTDYMQTDDLTLAWAIASRNSFDTYIFVRNTVTNIEVMISGGIVLCTTNVPPYTVPSQHTKEW